MSRPPGLSFASHSKTWLFADRMNDSNCHSQGVAHPIPQVADNRPTGTKITIPLATLTKRPLKHDSCPKSSLKNIKRLRLVVKAESDQRESSAILNIERRPHARIRIKKPSSGIESISNAYSATKETAHYMVKNAIQNTPYLIANFEITAILGWGGCGAVLGGVRLIDKRPVAIKMVYKMADRNTKKIELEIMSQISHPNIVTYLDQFEDANSFYLVMENFGTSWRKSKNNEVFAVSSNVGSEKRHSLLSVITGSSASLYDFIEEFGPVPPQLVLSLFKQLSSALGYLHHLGIVHGDIKEENILIGHENGLYLAKFCDFGHSRRTKRNRKDLRFYGTRDVSAPELFRNLRASEDSSVLNDVFYGYEEDVWALGLVLYTMIHGSLPENNDRIIDGKESLDGSVYYPTIFSSQITKDCKNLLERMLTIDYNKRITMAGILSHPWLTRTNL